MDAKQNYNMSFQSPATLAQPSTHTEQAIHVHLQIYR